MKNYVNQEIIKEKTKISIPLIEKATQTPSMGQDEKHNS